MAPRPTRSCSASRAASSVSNRRSGTSPTSARHGRSWLAACSTHSTPASDFRTPERSGQAMGSMRNIPRSEEHTSELQSHSDLVCRLLLEKKKKKSAQESGEREDKQERTA